MELFFKIAKVENLKFLILVIGIALLIRSIEMINPDKGVPAITPEEQFQEILKPFDIMVSKYVMTILWPLVFAFLNTFHKKIKVNPKFFNFILLIHFIGITLTLIMYFNFIPNGQEQNPNLQIGLDHMHFMAIVIYSLSLISLIFAFIWYKKDWFIFNSDKTSGNNPEEKME